MRDEEGPFRNALKTDRNGMQRVAHIYYEEVLRRFKAVISRGWQNLAN